MKTSIGLGGLVGFCVMAGFGGCSVLETDGIDSWTPTASTSSSSGSGTGGAGSTSSSSGMSSSSGGNGCMPKTPCGDAGDMVCNKKGECVPAQCANETMDPKETDTDCGGDSCPRCDKAQKCLASTDCDMGLVCADGVCCNSGCDTKCYSCNLSSIGDCSPVPLGVSDDNAGGGNDCKDQELCDGQGQCKLVVGEQCQDKMNCLSGFCYMTPTTDRCRLDVGAPCTIAEQADCFTKYCDNMNTCALAPIGIACDHDDQCASKACGIMSPSTCKLANGDACQMDTDCASNKCMGSPNKTCQP